MNLRVWTSLTVVWLGIALFAAPGCTAQLAHAYDRALVESINDSTPELLAFFASIDQGTQQGSFGGRQSTYNTLIGRYQAMAAQSAARPAPKSDVIERIDRAFGDRGLPAVAGDEIPSVVAFNKIAETLIHMRNTDRKQGLKGEELQAYRGQTTIYLDQALTYESFLER